MSDKIQIMIVDDNQSTRDNIRKLLEFEPDIEVTCEAASGEEAIRKAKIMAPDVILMDINMPGMDGIAATEAISNEVPQCLIVIISVQGEQEYLRRAMFAGAKDYLVKPFEGDELLQCIRHIYEREQKRRDKFVPIVKTPTLGKVITIFSTKGGIGKTTITTNLAAALGLDAESKVGVIDLDLQFGDVSLFLNTAPKATIADLVTDIENLDGSLLDSYMTKYKDNVKVLAAPLRPEQADSITAAHLAAIIKEMQFNYDYILIDTAPLFNEITFSVLDLSNTIMVATSQDLPTLKNVKLCLEILESLKYPEEKIKVILNRANSIGGMNMKDSEELLKKKIFAAMPSDGRTVVTAVNQGIPFVISNPDTVVAQTMYRLANYFISDDEEHVTAPTKKPLGKGVITKASRIFKTTDSGSKDTKDTRKDTLKEKEQEVVAPEFWSLS